MALGLRKGTWFHGMMCINVSVGWTGTPGWKDIKGSTGFADWHPRETGWLDGTAFPSVPTLTGGNGVLDPSHCFGVGPGITLNPFVMACPCGSRDP